MRVTPRPVELFLPPSPVARSKGVHQSAIIRSIAMEMGILKWDGVDEPTMADVRHITDPVAIQRICIGLAWEEWYIPQILSREGIKKHPGEMCVDNIYMTPDGVGPGGVIITPEAIQNKRYPIVPCIIHEVKATYKSINTVGDLCSQWLWLSQVKGYCKGAGTRLARLHVMFLCGDYKMPIQPVTKAWDLEFTQKEIDDNWSLLKDYRDYATE
jgi:hypothetical protein